MFASEVISLKVLLQNYIFPTKYIYGIYLYKINTSLNL